MALHCPACKTDSLRAQMNGDVEIDVCERCKGIWFDQREMEDISDVTAKELRAPRDAMQSALRCPRCSQPLHLFSYPQTSVAVAMCRMCQGVWVKADNYHALIRLREDLKTTGGLERYAPVGGVKGALINRIDSAISSLIRTLKS